MSDQRANRNPEQGPIELEPLAARPDEDDVTGHVYIEPKDDRGATATDA